MVPLVGFESGTVEYERYERVAGESHYPLSKMIALAVDGITSLSTKLIHLTSAIGLIISAASMIAIVWVIVMAALGNTVSGWASALCVILLLGGLQLVALGVIGEYIGKIYFETKHRPRYILEERLNL